MKRSRPISSSTRSKTPQLERSLARAVEGAAKPDGDGGLSSAHRAGWNAAALDRRPQDERAGGDIHQDLTTGLASFDRTGNLQPRLLVSRARLSLRRLSRAARRARRDEVHEADHRVSGEVSVGFVYAAQSGQPSRDNFSGRSRAGSRRARNWLSTWSASSGPRSLPLTMNQSPRSRRTTFWTRGPTSCGSACSRISRSSN